MLPLGFSKQIDEQSGSSISKTFTSSVEATYKGYNYLYGLLPKRVQNLTNSVVQGAAAFGLWKTMNVSNETLSNCLTHNLGMKVIWDGNEKMFYDLESIGLKNIGFEPVKNGTPIVIKGVLALATIGACTLALANLKEAVVPSPITETEVEPTQNCESKQPHA